MSFMVEIYFLIPISEDKLSFIHGTASNHGGSITFEELRPGSKCLTLEFPDAKSAEIAVQELKSTGFHIEGPVPYRD